MPEYFLSIPLTQPLNNTRTEHKVNQAGDPLISSSVDKDYF